MQYKSGTIEPKTFESYNINPSDEYVSNITNLKSSYTRDETARLRVYVRPKGWNPTIYSKANQETDTTIIESASYSIHRIVDDLIVIPHGTGTTGDPARGSVNTLHTLMSYDVSGNYFDFDMGMLEDGYSYAISTAYYNGAVGSWQEQPEKFKFKVESRQKE